LREWIMGIFCKSCWLRLAVYALTREH